MILTGYFLRIMATHIRLYISKENFRFAKDTWL